MYTRVLSQRDRNGYLCSNQAIAYLRLLNKGTAHLGVLENTPLAWKQLHHLQSLEPDILIYAIARRLC